MFLNGMSDDAITEHMVRNREYFDNMMKIYELDGEILTLEKSR